MYKLPALILPRRCVNYLEQGGSGRHRSGEVRTGVSHPLKYTTRVSLNIVVHWIIQYS